MTRLSQPDAAHALLALHQDPAGFIIPNAWDAGSAAILADAGFPAIATTSAGIAFSLGKQDYQVTDPRLSVSRDEMFERMAQIAQAVGVPVSGDLEAGFGDSPDAVAETLRLAIDAGLAGGNIEDKKPLEPALYDEDLAVERIAAGRAAIEARGGGFVLNARTDAFLVPSPDPLNTAITRANRFLEAGAHCVFVPGPADLATMATLAREIAGPVNIVLGLGEARANARDVLATGIRRISLGGAVARAALGFVRDCARDLRETGSLAFAERQIGGGELNAIFARTRLL